MSGICGAWAFDGRDPDLTPMLELLERRGPDATHAWVEGPVALGHTSLATTPEALLEVLPLSDPGSGCTITADVRLDNREELIAALGLGGEERVIGDGELILRAYVRWGEECPKHLLGDFAFAIWDPRAPRLFCARDHMGMRQLIYHHAPGKLFAFATEADALVMHGGVPKRINEGRIADFLDDLEGIDFTSTFFEEVVRLPPAHTLTVDIDGVVLRRYWTLTPGPELKLASDKAYADAFLEVFTDAVRCRLRSAGPVGSMLSGGMDSGSVVAIASRLLAAGDREPLRTFSAIGSDIDLCLETRTIEAALTIPGLAPTKVSHSDLAPFVEEMMRSTQVIDEPFDGHMTLPRIVYLAAHRDGVRVMLDGVGGDVSLTASNRVAHHVRRFRLGAAWREARGEELFWKIRWLALSSMLAATWSVYVPRRIRELKHKLTGFFKSRNRHEEPSMDRQFAKDVDRPARWRQFRSHGANNSLPDPQLRAQSILHPNLAAGRERYDRVAGSFGIEPRDPFLDIRLIAFCLTLPANQLQQDGWPKIILRRAMVGLLPCSVIWRQGKEHLGWTFTQALFNSWQDWPKILDEVQPQLSRYVTGLNIAPSNEEEIGGTTGPRSAFRTFFLACWLKRNHNSDDNVDSETASGLCSHYVVTSVIDGNRPLGQIDDGG